MLSSNQFNQINIQSRLQRLALTPQTEQLLAACLPHLLLTLSNAAHPDRVLVNFERFVTNAAQPEATLSYLAHNPRAIETLVILFAGSQFLTEILLRHPDYFEQITTRQNIAELKSAEELYQQLFALMEPHLAASPQDTPLLPALNALRRFQRRELLRIGTYDLLDLFDLPTVTQQLAQLADSLVRASLTLASWSTHTNPAEFTIIGMGKLGGNELNYSSDIDLLFIAKNEAGPFMAMAQHLIDILSRTTGEGFLYRVDMRLRPWGRSGPLVSTLNGHVAYLQKNAGLWEKQALLKARGIAGNETVAQAFLTQAQPLIFNHAGRTIQRDVRAMKERIEARLKRQGQLWGEVKLGQGSIRDIEFVTQYLQLVYGAENPQLHQPNTLEALAGLAATRLLSPADYRTLADGYIFLRTVEHHLQLMHYRQTHILPTDPDALTHLARRLRFQGNDAGRQFTTRYQQHSTAIRAVYRRYLAPNINGDEPMPGQKSEKHSPLTPVGRHVTRMPPGYSATFSEADIARHAELIARLGHDNLVEVEAVRQAEQPHQGGDLWRVTIVGYDYVGQLSLICGLLFCYGFDIVEGNVFSYGRDTGNRPGFRQKRRNRQRQRLRARPTADRRRKIVDVFIVRAMRDDITPQTWLDYDKALTALSWRLHQGEQREAQGELAKRVAHILRHTAPEAAPLYPVDIELDNDTSDRHTVLRLDAPDTIGFLYELTNALALMGINIRWMTVDTVGSRVRDILYVTDTQGQKITAPEKQRQLRVATALIKEFTHLLPRSPNPESALLNFRQFIGHFFTRPNWPDDLTSVEKPEVLQTLARLLGVSEFLWTDFLRMQYANLFPVLEDVAGLSEAKSRPQLTAELNSFMEGATTSREKIEALNNFKDREMFRIDMRQIQGHITEFGRFSAELTILTEVVVNAAYQLRLSELVTEYGRPLQPDGELCPMAVCALGKCGGRELGFASDIELMLVFDGTGHTTGPRVITVAEFFEKLVQNFSRTIEARREGIFEVDLRLRPYGRAGSMAVSLDSFRRYFALEGDAWPYERQALIKLRPIAGNASLGQKLVSLRDQLIYSGQPFDVAAMRAMRERQVRHLVTAGTINAKFSPGGLVDIEYLVQGLQINHGHHHPSLRSPNTREAMKSLAAADILSTEAYQQLYQALNFLRRLINALRMVRGHAKDLTVPPTASDEFDFLARRLDYNDDPTQLHTDLTTHTSRVQELSLRLLG